MRANRFVAAAGLVVVAGAIGMMVMAGSSATADTAGRATILGIA